MEKFVPIEVKTLGILYGRDSVFLDLTQQNKRNDLIFTGFISSKLNTRGINERNWFPYQLTFKQVLAYFSCEVDTYENLTADGQLEPSSFNLVTKSDWLKSLPIRAGYDKTAYQHYNLFTYDRVYNIIATDYEMVIAE